MKAIDPDAGDFIDAALDFGDSPVVYHTVYFTQPQVAQQLRGWLLDDAARVGLTTRTGLLTLTPSPRSPFTRVRYHDDPSSRRRSIPAMAAGGGTPTPNIPAGRQPLRAGLAGRVPVDTAAPPAPTGNVEEAAEEHARRLFGRPQPAPPPGVAHPAGAPLGMRAGAAPRGAAATPTPEAPRARSYAPTLQRQETQVSSITEGHRIHLVGFTQMHAQIPIFGTRAVIELDDAHNLVAARAKLARVNGVSPLPTLTPAQAFESLSKFARISAEGTHADVETRAAPQLTFYHDRETDRWHLAYVFADVPGLPAAWAEKKSRARAKRGIVRDGHGLGPSPRQRFPRLDYLVDANDGSVVYYYSVSPTLDTETSRDTDRHPAPARGGKSRGRGVKAPAKTAPRADRSPGRRAATAMNPLPASCTGVDDLGEVRTFDALPLSGGGFALIDPQRKIRTFDHAGHDIDDTPIAKNPISHTSFDFGDRIPAGVSAHFFSSRVFDFYNSVLIRKGIDDKGMELVNVVNVSSRNDEPPPEWHNAVWFNGRMWYGRQKGTGNSFESFARHLDIIAHELTHGVTETTSNLVYRDEAGALNESFSDIFGVMIKNWVLRGPDTDPDTWDWNIGAGLGVHPGNPLRNMKNPRLTGDPDHMRDFKPLDPEDDFGGVHTYSNINNKAAYNLLTSRVPDKKNKRKGRALVFRPSEVARLYYFTLQRLDRVATFEDVLDTLLDVVKTVYPNPAEQALKSAAVKLAYEKIGVPRA
jgi:bacillolysin/neutral peptidase B